MLDDVMVVVKTKSSDINGLVERPGIRCVLLREHLSDELRAEMQIILLLLREHFSSFQTASEMMLRVGLRCFSFGLLKWAIALATQPSVRGDGR